MIDTDQLQREVIRKERRQNTLLVLIAAALIALSVAIRASGGDWLKTTAPLWIPAGFVVLLVILFAGASVARNWKR